MKTVTAACMNPNCRARVRWPASSGRPSMFCSTACRTTTNTTIDRLLRQLQESDEPQTAQILWQLQRYRAFVDLTN